jgi:hypothetical protein
MFGLFKRKLSPKNRAYIIAKNTSDYTVSLDETVNSFIQQNPKFTDKRNNIIDELQWIIATGGLISIRIISDHKKTKATYEQLIEFYHALHLSNNNNSTFNSDYLEKLKTKFDNYLVRFNRGIVFRDQNANSYNEALIDVANESMKYFTGEIRHSQIKDLDDIDKLQERTEPSELELFVKDILNQFIKIFMKEFEQTKFI